MIDINTDEDIIRFKIKFLIGPYAGQTLIVDIDYCEIELEGLVSALIDRNLMADVWCNQDPDHFEVLDRTLVKA